MSNGLKVIVSGGGTGGHIFPAISIADAIRSLEPHAEILFVGALGRMEMTRVPQAGYKIIGLPVMGFDRKHLLKNIKVMYCLMKSRRIARRILKEFRPDIAIGVGGYASGPMLKEAARKNVPILIQEQNSYAGVTNKLLAKDAKVICVAYQNMERFFPKDKILLTGNPIRHNLLVNDFTKEMAYSAFGLDPDKSTIAILGGSLGARTINESVMHNLELIRKSANVQVLWQTGKIYFEEMKQRLAQTEPVCNLFPIDFISGMNMLYSISDLVISRAGAGSISEFAMLGKAVILVPSPNVAEDHQTKNALSLSNMNAAVYIPDSDAKETLIPSAFELAHDNERLEQLRSNIKNFAMPDSARIIAEKALQIVETNDYDR